MGSCSDSHDTFVVLIMMTTGICIIKLATHLGGAAFFYCPGHFPRWAGGGSEGGARLPLGLKTVMVPLRVFSLKRSTSRALVVPFRVLSRKNTTRDNLLF